MTALSPLGARIESCRGAVKRATERADIARKAVEMAQAALAEAESFRAEKGKELQALEQEFASTVNGATLQEGNSLQEMEVSMKRIVEEMQSGGRIPTHIVDQKKERMAALFQELSSLAQTCQMPCQISSPAEYVAPALAPIPLQTAIDARGVLAMLGATPAPQEIVSVVRQDQNTVTGNPASAGTSGGLGGA